MKTFVFWMMVAYGLCCLAGILREMMVVERIHRADIDTMEGAQAGWLAVAAAHVRVLFWCVTGLAATGVATALA